MFEGTAAVGLSQFPDMSAVGDTTFGTDHVTIPGLGLADFSASDVVFLWRTKVKIGLI